MSFAMAILFGCLMSSESSHFIMPVPGCKTYDQDKKSGTSDERSEPREKKVFLWNGKDVEAPIFTKKVTPKYPRKGRLKRIQGNVILRATLGKDGTIYDIKVLQGPGDGKYGFEKKAIKALKKWKYKPGKVNHQPADIRMILTIDFVLR